MASFSISSKTYAKDKLSRCVTTVLIVCCYLYRKRSNAINVNAEAEEQGSNMQTLEKRASFPLVLIGALRKESLARAKLPVG